jgi:hypothetical protein
MRQSVATLIVGIGVGIGGMAFCQERVPKVDCDRELFELGAQPEVPREFRFLRFGIPSGCLRAAWAALPDETISLERVACYGSCPAYKGLERPRITLRPESRLRSRPPRGATSWAAVH